MCKVVFTTLLQYNARKGLTATSGENQSISLHTAASLSVYCLAGWRGALLCMQGQTVSTRCAALVAHTRGQLSATGRQVCATGDLQVIYTRMVRPETGNFDMRVLGKS